MTVRYQQLLLGLGQHEEARLPFLVVIGNFEDGGFDTWQQAVTHFRDTLIALVNERGPQSVAGSCISCVNKTPTEEDLFCHRCGRSLETVEMDVNVEAARLFGCMFDTSMDGFSDWDHFTDNGWEIGANIEAASFVQVHTFEKLLETWDEHGDKRFEVALEQEWVRLVPIPTAPPTATV